MYNYCTKLFVSAAMAITYKAASFCSGLSVFCPRPRHLMSKGTPMHPRPLTVPLPVSDAANAQRLTLMQTGSQIPMLGGCSSHNGHCDSTTVSSTDHLVELLGKDSDVQLLFKNSTGAPEIVPAHSQILRMWSGALTTAMDAAQQQPNSTEKQMVELVMTDVSKKEWLLTMQFFYPVLPEPRYDWENLDTLLKVACSYEFTAFKEQLGWFIETHTDELTDSACSESEYSVWRWITLADRYGPHSAAKACIDSRRDMKCFMSYCDLDQLHDLSGQTLECIIKKMVACGG